MAIVLVLSVIAVMTIVVVELSFTTRISSEIAMNQRDELKALYLAKAGYQYSKIILTIDNSLQSQIKKTTENLPEGTPALGFHLWDYFPVSYPPEVIALLDMAKSMQGGEEGEQTAATPSEGSGVESDGSSDQAWDQEEYYDVEIKSESCKINLNSLAEEKQKDLQKSGIFKLLVNLLSLEEYLEFFKDNYNLREDLIYAIKDWVDEDSMGSNPRAGMDENTPYQSRADRYRVKNAPFDSFEEIFLVEGMSYKLYAEIFEKYTTVYGDKDNKINIACNHGPIVKAILDQSVQYDKDELLKALEERGGFDSPKDLEEKLKEITGVKTPIDADIKGLLTAEDTKYRVVSTGTVGQVSKVLTTVVQRGSSAGEQVKLLYWRVQ
ncbi:MAG: hypothetical protein A2284_12710 [Deltaproteobacteria bacterium RIFOXYA12_FULL_61_11]|nr:MAG: hypothetical protein A2284_12710 [Deltaproteobacteria bacterium RIFOXYA12_FULL_61_11]